MGWRLSITMMVDNMVLDVDQIRHDDDIDDDGNVMESLLLVVGWRGLKFEFLLVATYWTL
jgi:hypothetical protein